MKKENPFLQIQIDALKGNKEKSYEWYKNQIRKLGLTKLVPQTALRSEMGELVTNIKWGNMYLFMYNPENRETLPVYDMFPLVLPFRLIPNGFVGLNFHYLPPLLRLKLLNRLLVLANNSTLSETTKIQTTWNVLSNASRFPEVAPCVKRYKFQNVRSKFLKINPKDWKTSVLLPLETFKKSSANTVFKNSRDIINA